MTTPDIERLEQHLAANPRLRQALVFDTMAAGMARVDRDVIDPPMPQPTLPPTIRP